MPFLNPIFGKFIGVAVAIAFFAIALLAARRARPTFNLEGELVMRYSPLLQIIANLLGFGVPTIALIVFLVVPPKGVEWIPTLLFLSSAFIVIAIIYLEIIIHRIVISEEGIRFITPFQRTRAYEWCDIVDVSYKSKLVPFVFHCEDGRHFSVSSLMTGMSLLIEVFKAQLDPKKYQSAIKGIEWSNSMIKDRWNPNNRE
jgi:hypothetical protein